MLRELSLSFLFLTLLGSSLSKISVIPNRELPDIVLSSYDQFGLDGSQHFNFGKANGHVSAKATIGEAYTIEDAYDHKKVVAPHK